MTNHEGEGARAVIRRNSTNCSGICAEGALSRTAAARRQSEGGYTLVALLLVMSLLALWAVAAAENVRQQAQREREKEAMFRGEQVADAIRAYFRFRGAQGVNSLPTSMDQLLEGIPRGTKKLQILLAEDARVPL